MSYTKNTNMSKNLIDKYINKYKSKKFILDHIKTLSFWHRDIRNLREFLFMMYENECFIDAKTACNIIRDTGPDSCRKAKYILSMVIDTWNITKENGFKETEVRIFKKPIPDVRYGMSAIRKKYHSYIIRKMIIRSESIFGCFGKDSENVKDYECY